MSPFAQPTCLHCSFPIEKDDTFGDWFHIGRTTSDTDMKCNPSDPDSKWAEPAN